MSGLDDARFWLDLLQWATTAGIGLYVFISARHRATRSQIREVEKEAAERLDRHAERLIRLEARLEHVPSNDVIERLGVRLGDLHGDFKQMSGWLEGVKGLLEMLKSNVQQLVDNELRGSK